MRYFLLSLLSLTLFAADPVEPKLPTEVQSIVDVHDAQVAKAKAVYDKAVLAAKADCDKVTLKADADALKKLEPVITKLTKAGDLQGALAGQKVGEGWKVVDERDPRNGVVDLGKVIVGKWTITETGTGKKYEYNFIPKGIFNRWDGSHSWSVVGNSLKLMYNNGIIDTVTFDKDMNGTINSAILGSSSATMVAAK